MSWVNHLRNELMCPTSGVHFSSTGIKLAIIDFFYFRTPPCGWTLLSISMYIELIEKALDDEEMKKNKNLTY
jgi:hypothetical protein